VGNPYVVVWADSSVATQLLRGPTCNPLAGKGLDASHNAGMSLDQKIHLTYHNTMI
jgi:hypothetical protein